ncbi:MAG: hypothetical protein HYY30_00690 [Chloroflexi bacterium]|nr:hypothetical protein [Chloroflexota bacterium]
MIRRGWRERLAGWVFGDVIDRRVMEASLAEEDRLWRSISATVGTRDVNYRELVDEMNDSVEAYRVNPLAFRIVELTTDFVLGRGMAVRSPSASVQAFIDEFWEHPMNRMATRQFDMCTELSLSGELFVTLHTNPFDRMTYVRLVPAVAIDRIEANPEDLEDERRYHRVGMVPAVVEGIDWVGKIEGGTEGRWWNVGECRHFAVNRVVGALRGQGDLVPMLPWLRRYKDWLTDRVRINKFKGAFLWDVELKGADPGALARRRGELAVAPNPGSVIVHNEKEVWKAVQPEIDAQAVEPDGKAMRLMVAAGAGIPLHFLAEGESATKATAQEMGGPTLRHYERRQLYFAFVLTEVVREAIARSGRFKGKGVELEAKYEDLSTQDNLRVAQAAKMIGEALKVGVESGWVDKGQAARIFERFCAEPLGMR